MEYSDRKRHMKPRNREDVGIDGRINASSCIASSSEEDRCNSPPHRVQPRCV